MLYKNIHVEKKTRGVVFKMGVFFIFMLHVTPLLRILRTGLMLDPEEVRHASQNADSACPLCDGKKS
jgi:hypothetical protein